MILPAGSGLNGEWREHLRATIRNAVHGHDRHEDPNEITTTAPQSGLTQMRTIKTNRSLSGTDAEAIEFAAEANMSKADLQELWHSRYLGSEQLRAEFQEEGHYAAFMNAQLRKHRAKNPQGNSGDDRPLATLDADEQTAMTTAKHMSKEQRTALWHSRWAASSDLQAEFLSKENYAAFMNAVAEGRVKIFRRKVQQR